MKELQAQVRQDGFAVKFMQVRGPDIVWPMAPPSRRTSSCDSLLIVAGSRETDNFSAGRRARLKGYRPWENVGWLVQWEIQRWRQFGSGRSSAMLNICCVSSLV